MTTQLSEPSELGSPKRIHAVNDPTLFSLIRRLADNKYWLGRRYAEWCTAAPTLESAVAAAAMSQDEIGHARSHYPLFRQFVGHDIEPEDVGEFHSVSALDRAFDGWMDFIAANFLIDTAFTVMYEAATDSVYDDLKNRSRRIQGEERIHWLHGSGWIKRLATESEGTREALLTALERLSIESLMWFGEPDDAVMANLLDRGVLSKAPDEMREAFLARIQPVLTAAKLNPQGLSGTNLPWSRWDSLRYRLP